MGNWVKDQGMINRARVCSLLMISLFLCHDGLSSEDNTYDFKWLDTDKEVYVLQNRKFRKTRRLFVQGGFGITTSGAFANANVFQGRAGWFYNEDFGASVFYSANNSKTNSTFESVRVQQAIPFVRQVESYYGAMVHWAPFYAKINTFNKVIYFDWIFGLGVSQITEENNRNEFDSTGETALTKEKHTGLAWDIGLRFYLTQMLSLQVDFLGIHYKARQAIPNSGSEEFYNNFDLTLSAVFSL